MLKGFRLFDRLVSSIVEYVKLCIQLKKVEEYRDILGDVVRHCLRQELDNVFYNRAGQIIELAIFPWHD
jgi:hypothetical protein